MGNNVKRIIEWNRRFLGEIWGYEKRNKKK